MSTCMEAIRLVSSSITSLLFKIGSLTELVAYQLSWLANQRHLFISASLNYETAVANFYLDARHPNSGLHKLVFGSI